MTEPTVQRIQALQTQDLNEFIKLMKNYFLELDQVPEFYGTDKDMTSPLAVYHPPAGCFWLAHEGRDLAGMIGVLPINRGTCELRRLYVMPEHRRSGWGQRLMDTALAFAKQAGYFEVLVALHASQSDALAMFERNDFKPCARYNDDRKVGIFLSRKLNAA